MKKLLALLTVICALPLSAQSNDVAVWLTSQMNSNGGKISPDGDVDVRFDDGAGFGVSFSHRFGGHLSGELAVFSTSSSATLRALDETADLGDIKLKPITAMLRYHFSPDGKFDAYAGGGVAYTIVSDLDSADLRSQQLAPVHLDDKTSVVVGGGIAFHLWPRGAIALDARYIPLKLSGHPPGETDRVSTNLDPLLISAGLKFRF